ncbi:MAG: glycosyltransferase family 2 protein [Candidatus Aenigmarchaeota archaeon]|nr:glycosyltransferase family 2 protein [Candidatus Aenigmarchaeota archaeon]
MRVSVIVPAYNEKKLLPGCLESLKSQSHPCEIVVCDNGSTDGSIKIASKYADKVVVEKRRGALFALNTGLQNASGDLLAITGADCIVPPDWVETFVKQFGKHDVIGCYGPVDPLEDRHGRYFSLMNYAEKACIRLGLWFVIQGANFMVRKEIMEKAGYFDPSVEVFEENGMFRKIKKLGKVRFVSKNPIKASTRRVDECGKLHLILFGLRQMLSLTVSRRTDTSRFKVVRQC